MMMESVMVSIGCKKQQGFSQIEHSKASASASSHQAVPRNAEALIVAQQFPASTAFHDIGREEVLTKQCE